MRDKSNYRAANRCASTAFSVPFAASGRPKNRRHRRASTALASGRQWLFPEFIVAILHTGPNLQCEAVTTKCQIMVSHFCGVLKSNVQTLTAPESEFVPYATREGFHWVGTPHHDGGGYLHDPASFLSRLPAGCVLADFATVYKAAWQRPLGILFPVPPLDEQYLAAGVLDQARRHSPAGF